MTPKTKPTATPLEIVNLRNYFYQDIYHQLMKVLLVLLLLLASLYGLRLAELEILPYPKYFVTSVDGEPLELISKARPNMTHPELIQWAVEAATDAYTFNFVNYRKALQKARAYFTARGHRAYLVALKESQNLDAVKRRKLVVYAIQSGAAKILRDSESDPSLRINGAFTWEIEIPMLITYENVTEKFPQNVILTAYVVRESYLVSEKGVGIHSYVLREVKGR